MSTPSNSGTWDNIQKYVCTNTEDECRGFVILSSNQTVLQSRLMKNNDNNNKKKKKCYQYTQTIENKKAKKTTETRDTVKDLPPSWTRKEKELEPPKLCCHHQRFQRKKSQCDLRE